jgi:methyl-accepting chemotaxis protein
MSGLEMKRAIVMATAVLMLGGCAPQPSAVPQKACMSAAQLNTYGYDHLEKVAKLLREDKKNIESFELFINAMKGTVDSYSDMIKSSVYISNVVRFLPIPYAGEVCNTTKLVSKTVLNLGGAASALNRYKNSSDTFLASFDKLNRTNVKAGDISKLAVYADTKLLKDANDLEAALQEISSSTAMMAATTQSIADALDTTGAYVDQAKSFVGLSQPGGDDKSKVVQNRNSINTRMAQLNQKIASLEKSGRVHQFNIAKARIYSELAVQLEQ